MFRPFLGFSQINLRCNLHGRLHADAHADFIQIAMQIDIQGGNFQKSNLHGSYIFKKESADRMQIAFRFNVLCSENQSA